MDKRVRLDVGSISVASFDTSRDENGINRPVAFITSSTFNACCVNTVCRTNAECSTGARA